MKKLLITLLSTSVLIILITSCDKFKRCPDCFTPPDEIIFNIISSNDSADLIYNGLYNADSLSIYYVENNIKKYIEREVFSDTIHQRSLVVSNELSWKSSEGHKDFFLYLNSSDIDTIFLDVVEKHSNCCTHFEIDAFYFNDVMVKWDSTEGLYNIIK